MIVRRIALNGWRNYAFAAAEFSPGTNVITGENAQGKTNLLEAVYLLTGGKSFRTRFDRELIGFGYTSAEVLADVYAFGREQTVRVVLRQGQRKQIWQNGVKKTAAELAGNFAAVLFCPDDLNLIKATIENAGTQIVTMALRRCRTTENNLLDYIPKGITMLPNTSGARNADEAVRIARLAREVCQTDFVKVEIEHEAKYLLPDNEETIKATEKLAKEGFVVMPYMFPDPIAAKRLEDAGAACVMPLGAMIGSNKGLRARDFIEVIIKNSNVPVIIDAGIGRPSQAAEAMEMGADAVMAYTAIASAGNIPLMARAFKNAIEAGREAYLSGLGKVTENHAVPSSPTNEADYIG